MLLPLDICALGVCRIVWNCVFVIVFVRWLFHVSRTHHVLCFNRKDPEPSRLMNGCSSWVKLVWLNIYTGYSHPWLVHKYHRNKMEIWWHSAVLCVNLLTASLQCSLLNQPKINNLLQIWPKNHCVKIGILKLSGREVCGTDTYLCRSVCIWKIGSC
jgi:hypothetical protein